MIEGAPSNAHAALLNALLPKFTGQEVQAEIQSMHVCGLE